VTQGRFDDLPPYRRHLNLSRFLLILLGPEIFVGLCIVAVCWIVRGFRSAPSRGSHSEPNAARRPLPPARPESPSQKHARAWLQRLPRRWGRNAAIGGGALAALSTMPFLSRSDGASAAFMLSGLAVVTLGLTGAGYLCERWARYSLKAALMLNPASAVARIIPN